MAILKAGKNFETAIACAILCFVVAAFPRGAMFAVGMLRHGFLFVSNFEQKSAALVTPRISEEYIKPEVRDAVLEALTIVRQRREPLADFRFSTRIKSDDDTFYRIIETNYPNVRYNPASPHLILLADEMLPADCALETEGKYVQLAVCS